MKIRPCGSRFVPGAQTDGRETDRND